MRFRGLRPLQPGVPIIEVSDDKRSFDLHNECILQAMEYLLQQRCLVLRFQRSKTVSKKSTTRQAIVALEIGGVKELQLSGNLVADNSSEPLGLDFMEYSPVADDLGRLRFVLDNDAEVVVLGTRCQLKFLESHE